MAASKFCFLLLFLLTSSVTPFKWSPKVSKCYPQVYLDPSDLPLEERQKALKELQEIPWPLTRNSIASFLKLVEQDGTTPKPVARFQQHCNSHIIYPGNAADILEFLNPQAFKNMVVVILEGENNNRYWPEEKLEFSFSHFEPKSEGNNYIFIRIFPPKKLPQAKRIYHTDEVLEFSSEDGVSNMQEEIKERRPTDALRGQHFRVGIFDLKPQYYTHGGRTLGTAYNIILYGAQKYNFTFELSIAGTTVAQLPDGTFTGFEFDLVYNRSDMLFLYTASFLQHTKVDATSYFSTASIVFLTSLPSTVVDWRAIMYPLKFSTWAVILALAGFTILALFFKQRLSPYEEFTSSHAFLSSLDIVFLSLLGQAVNKISDSARIIALIWIWGCFIFLNYYLSNLLSYLTYPSSENIPTDFYQLAHRRDYRINGIDLPGGPMEQFFNITTNPELVSIRNRYFLNPDWGQCVLDGVTKRKEVCIGWDFIVQGFILTNATVHEQFYPAFKSKLTPITVLTNAILQKNSIYFGGMSEIMSWFRDTGHYFHWEREAESFIKHVGKAWMSSRRGSETYGHLYGKFLEATDVNEKPLTLLILRPPFGFLVIGVCCGLVAFLSEVYVSRRGGVTYIVRGLSARVFMKVQAIESH